MENLKIKMLLIGWVRYPDDGNEKVFVMPVREKVIKARAQLNPFFGTMPQVQEEVEKRVAKLNVLSIEHAMFTVNNINWGASYYVLKTAEEKYRALFYAALDGSYLLFDLFTEDSLMQMRLLPEAKRLISCVDYSCMWQGNLAIP